MQEIWEDIKGYEGAYQVSNFGNVLSLNYHRAKINKQLKTHLNSNGYVFVRLCKNNTVKNYFVHRLVAEAFIPNIENKPQINHIDGNKQNNTVNNLEWVNNSQNQKHAYKIGLRRAKKGIANSNHREINQYDIKGNLIYSWLYVKEASDFFNISSSSIILCCQHKNKTAGGFVWEYAD